MMGVQGVHGRCDLDGSALLGSYSIAVRLGCVLSTSEDCRQWVCYCSVCSLQILGSFYNGSISLLRRLDMKICGAATCGEIMQVHVRKRSHVDRPEAVTEPWRAAPQYKALPASMSARCNGNLPSTAASSGELP
jgi:hypothetical protein